MERGLRQDGDYMDKMLCGEHRDEDSWNVDAMAEEAKDCYNNEMAEKKTKVMHEVIKWIVNGAAFIDQCGTELKLEHHLLFDLMELLELDLTTRLSVTKKHIVVHENLFDDYANFNFEELKSESILKGIVRAQRDATDLQIIDEMLVITNNRVPTFMKYIITSIPVSMYRYHTEIRLEELEDLFGINESLIKKHIKL